MGTEELAVTADRLNLSRLCWHGAIALCHRSRNLLESRVTGHTRQGFFTKIMVPTLLSKTWKVNCSLKWLSKTSSVDSSGIESILEAVSRWLASAGTQMGTVAHGLKVETHRCSLHQWSLGRHTRVPCLPEKGQGWWWQLLVWGEMTEAAGPGQIKGRCREQQQSMASENMAQVSGCRGSGPTLPLPGHVCDLRPVV